MCKLIMVQYICVTQSSQSQRVGGAIVVSKKIIS